MGIFIGGWRYQPTNRPIIAARAQKAVHSSHLSMVYSLLAVMKLECCSGISHYSSQMVFGLQGFTGFFSLFCFFEKAAAFYVPLRVGLMLVKYNWKCWNRAWKQWSWQPAFFSYSLSVWRTSSLVLLLYQGVCANEAFLFGRDWVQPSGPALLPLRHSAGDCLPLSSNCGHQLKGCFSAVVSRQPVSDSLLHWLVKAPGCLCLGTWGGL